jgi:uncharacterized protein (TIGR00369 family)
MQGGDSRMQFTPRNPDFRSVVERYAAAQGYLRLLGAEIVALDPGLVAYRVGHRPDLVQQDGVFHGGVIGGVAEAAMGGAAKTLVEPGANVVGVEFKANFLAGAGGVAIIARGLVIRPGRSLIVCRADVVSVAEDGSEQLCAIGQGTMAVVNPRA